MLGLLAGGEKVRITVAHRPNTVAEGTYIETKVVYFPQYSGLATSFVVIKQKNGKRAFVPLAKVALLEELEDGE